MAIPDLSNDVLGQFAFLPVGQMQGGVLQVVRGDELAQLVAVVTRGERLDKGGVLEGGQAGVGWFFQADGVQCGVQRVLFLEDKQPRAEVAVVVGAGVLVSAPARGSVPDEGLVILDQTRLGRV